MTYTIKKQIDKFRPDGNSMANISTTFVLIVPDIHAAVDAIAALPGNEKSVYFYWHYNFDTNLNRDDQILLANDLSSTISDFSHKAINKTQELKAANLKAALPIMRISSLILVGCSIWQLSLALSSC